MKSESKKLYFYVLIFTAAYIVFEAIYRSAIVVFELESSLGASVGIILGASIAASQKFHKDNHRNFSDSEKRSIVLLSTISALIISLIQPFIIAAFFLGIDVLINPLEIIKTFTGEIKPTLIAISLGFLVVFNYVALYFSYSYLSQKSFDAAVKKGKYQPRGQTE